MDLFDDEQVTTADKIDRPQQALEKEAIDDFMKRNPMAGGGMLVQPGFGGTRQGYANPKGNPEFGKTITGEKFKDTIRPQNLEKLKKLEEIITKSNSQYKKSLTSKAALELAGFKDGYQAIATTGRLREEVKKLIGTLQSTGNKMDNYINNVMLSEDALVKDFKNPMQHLQKKFGVSRGFTDKWSKTSQVVQDNKRLFNNLANDLSFNKYKKYADGTPRLMSDFSVVVQNKLPSSMPFMRGDSAEKFILQSAYRHFKYNKDVGKASKITFIGDPDLLPINEWKFIKGNKLFSLDPAEDTLKFQGKTYKNNYLNRVDAKDIYKNDFGNVYKIFDDLDTYMNTTLEDGTKLDTKLRRKLFDATGKKDYLLRRAVEIDHFDINKDPFSNLRLLNRRTNVQAGLLKRLPKYKNNPKLLNKVLTDIGYTTPYKDVDTFIKRSVKNIDTPIKIIGETPIKELNIRKPVSTDGPRLGSLDIPSIFRKLSPATRKLVGFGGGTVLPEVLFYQLDKANRMSKGVSEKEAAAGALESGTLGAYTNKAYMEELKKVAESMNIDSGAFDSAYNLNVLSKSFEQNSKNVDAQIATALENQDVKTAEELRKNFNKYVARIKPEAERLRNDIEERVTGGSPLTMSKGRGNVTDKQYSKPFYDMQDVALEKLKKEKQKVFDTQKRQVDTAAGNIGEGFYQAFDTLTQGAKNLLKGRIIPFGPDRLRPLESEREKEARYLKEMDPRELFLYNKARGFTYDNPITEADLSNLQYEQPGLFSKGGRAGFKLGTIRKGVLSLIDESVKKTPTDITPDLDALIKKTLDEDFFDKKDRIIDNINAKISRARAKGLDSEEIGEGQIEFYDDITKSNFKTKTGPFFDRRKRAGGGILKQAGDRSGAMLESMNPDSQGLQGLMKRGIKT
jgi:hypothetical protein